MSSREEWIAVTERVREAAKPARSPDLGRLHRLAMEEARLALQRMPWVKAPDVEDLVQDKLCDELEAVIAANDPRAFFRTMMKRAALDLRRSLAGAPRADGSRRSFVPIDGPTAESPVQLRSPDESPEEAVERRQEAAAVLAGLSPRERQVFEGLRQGEDRDELAGVLGLSRSNLDQIVSRARRRLGAEA